MTTLSSTARASVLPELPEHALILGPSGAWVSGAGSSPDAAVLGVDATYVHDNLWATAGLRLRLDGDGVDVYYPYAEAGMWFLLNLGVGYSLGLAPERSASSNLHFFVGMPIPVAKWLHCVEPYYRPTWDGDHLFHELGVLVKWWLFYETPSDRRQRAQTMGPWHRLSRP